MSGLPERLLAGAAGMNVPAASLHRDDFEALCGIWTERDVRAFEARVADTGQINPEDWGEGDWA